MFLITVYILTLGETSLLLEKPKSQQTDIKEYYTHINSNTINSTSSISHKKINTINLDNTEQGKNRPKDLTKKRNKNDHLKLCFVDTHSALLKVPPIKDYIIEHDIDIVLYC